MLPSHSKQPKNELLKPRRVCTFPSLLEDPPASCCCSLSPPKDFYHHRGLVKIILPTSPEHKALQIFCLTDFRAGVKEGFSIICADTCSCPALSTDEKDTHPAQAGEFITCHIKYAPHLSAACPLLLSKMGNLHPYQRISYCEYLIAFITLL